MKQEEIMKRTRIKLNHFKGVRMNSVVTIVDI